MIVIILCNSIYYSNATNSADILQSYLEPYIGLSDYRIEFTTQMGDTTNFYSGDSIDIRISKRGDSIYIDQGTFEILQDATDLIFVNHLMQGIYYTPLVEKNLNNIGTNFFQNPLGIFNSIMQDTLSLEVEDQSSEKVFILNLNTNQPKIYFSKVKLYFNSSGEIIKSIYFQKNDSRVITYFYRTFLSGENIDNTLFDKSKFIIGGQVSPSYSTYTLEKM
ncbi:MAG TPA: hypothetical protein VLZ75_07385 [Chitinophagales bacterium]|nr:hypothetical protein [Chitinophagales bacterium]